VSRIQARQIRESDLPAVADLLTRGFPERGRTFWLDVLARLREHSVPDGLAKYGYLLDNGGSVIGAILLIFSRVSLGEQNTVRCNVSSWFVEPAFRSYASLLMCKALSQKEVTYLNTTPAAQTVQILLAQGYSKHNGGVFVAVPALTSHARAADVKVVRVGSASPLSASAAEHELLLEHASYGCLSLWCVTADRAYPFVFRLRTIKRLLPAAQLIYARHVEDFARMSGSVGRFLVARGRGLVLIDADGPIPGLFGKYFDRMQPKYFKGPHQPPLGDLAYTEAALFGIF
jgi:hypothetical protein